MKMWVVKTVHLPERVRNFNKYKRLIVVALISAVLIISIIYMGRFFPTAKSGSGGNSGSFEIYLESVMMTNVTIGGPYNFSSINVTKITADVANMSEMLLVKEGSRLDLTAPTAFATKLVVYTTYLEGRVKFDGFPWIFVYGNESVPPLPTDWLYMTNAYMKAVYLEAESFSAPELSLTCT